VRFNPPPSWPPVPEGWQPPPGWTPDPSWPAAPEGWQLWVDDEGNGVEPLEAQALEARTAHRKQAVKSFWLGVAIFLAGAITTIIASGSGGGVIWYGGMIFGAILLFRAVTSYRASRSEGAAPLGMPGKAIAAAGLIGCLAVGGLAVGKLVEAKSLTPSADSCWKSEGEEVVLVSCSSGHEYRGVGLVQDEAECPATAVGWVEGDGTTLVCLAED
jgi:hypothetical protein